jgi:hypothetical protein
VILVDSSIWIRHLRTGDAELERLLLRREVFMHPFVLGELALGDLRARRPVLSVLEDLPGAETATHHEVMSLIETERLHARGIGYVDAHLLASTLLTADALLWTADRRLKAAAITLGVAFPA